MMETGKGSLKKPPQIGYEKMRVDSSKPQRVYIYLILIIALILAVFFGIVIYNRIQIQELQDQLNSCGNYKVTNVDYKDGNVLKIEKDQQQEKIQNNDKSNHSRHVRSIVLNGGSEGRRTTQSVVVTPGSSESPSTTETTTPLLEEQDTSLTEIPNPKYRKNRRRNKQRGGRKNKSDRKKKASKQKVAVHLISNIPTNTWSLAMKMGPNEKHHFHHGFIHEQAYSPYNVTFSFWTLDYWCKRNSLVNLHHNTTLTVKETGTYYVYVQIMYRDDKRMWAVAVFIDDLRFIQCVGSKSVPADSGATSHQCNAAGTTYIEKDQRLHVGSLYSSSKLILLPSATFWGLIKLD